MALQKTLKEKKTTPDAVSNKKRKTFLNPMIIPFSRPVRSCRRFLQYSLFYFIFISKNMNRSTPPNCLLPNPLHSHNLHTAYRSALNKYISCSRSKRKTYLPAFPTILFQKSKQAVFQLWVRSNLFNEFLMYALSSVHGEFVV